tara:strand:+ start:2349 stop:4187 length:1839 start_codon:yes stop_codon:yes gene_type:complete
MFQGGFAGVDVFFVISGYLITTILIKDIEQGQLRLGVFYERRVRRIAPVLLCVLTVTSIASYCILLPHDLEIYGKSLRYVCGFISNLFFAKHTGYFDTAQELTPLLHTWSLSIEEQFYVIFPIMLYAIHRYRQHHMLSILVVFTLISLLACHFGWQHKASAKFFSLQARAWELLIGVLTALITRRYTVPANNSLALLGLGMIVYALLAYDAQTPSPSLSILIPVLGAAFVILFAQKQTWVAHVLSTQALVSLGLISYSAYLWHQPLFALTRRLLGTNLSTLTCMGLIASTLILSYVSWRYIEQPFRSNKAITAKPLFIGTFICLIGFCAFSWFIKYTHGAKYRYPDLPAQPQPWASIECHGRESLQRYQDPLQSCLQPDTSSQYTSTIYLVGDSHAAQLTFALAAAAAKNHAQLRFINTEDSADYPQSFWRRQVEKDRILDYILHQGRPGDWLVTSFHRGYLNTKRDVHLKRAYPIQPNLKAHLFESNLAAYLTKFDRKSIDVLLVKDGPLLLEQNTNLEICKYLHQQGRLHPCELNQEQDRYTRTRQSRIFDRLAHQFQHVTTLDYLPVLYQDGTFSPISAEGEYLMFDRHHITATASYLLTDTFEQALFL